MKQRIKIDAVISREEHPLLFADLSQYAPGPERDRRFTELLHAGVIVRRSIADWHCLLERLRTRSGKPR
jgi:hypothetical protein